MLIIHGTAAFRAKVARPPAGDATSTTALGAWYANIIRRRRPYVLAVNERTLLPVVMPLAPAKTFTARFPDQAVEVMTAIGAPPEFVDREREAMQEVQIAPTANRSVVGVMNDMIRWLDLWDLGPDPDLLDLSLRLAERPSGRLQFIAPSDELRSVVGVPLQRGRRRPTAPEPKDPTSIALTSVRGPDGRTIEIRHRPGLADELMQELKPLLAADGIELDDPVDAPDLERLRASLAHAVERRNLELFTPVGPRRDAAVAALLLFAAAVEDEQHDLARTLLDRIEPEPHRPDVAEVSAVIGLALGLLDDWLTDRSGRVPRDLAQRARVPAEWRPSARVTTEILALAGRGRASSSSDSLIVHHGGLQVLTGAMLAVAAVTQAWARSTTTPVGVLLPRVLR